VTDLWAPIHRTAQCVRWWLIWGCPLVRLEYGTFDHASRWVMCWGVPLSLLAKEILNIFPTVAATED